MELLKSATQLLTAADHIPVGGLGTGGIPGLGGLGDLGNLGSGVTIGSNGLFSSLIQPILGLTQPLQGLLTTILQDAGTAADGVVQTATGTNGLLGELFKAAASVVTGLTGASISLLLNLNEQGSTGGVAQGPEDSFLSGLLSKLIGNQGLVGGLSK